ncbi:4946_t:CDS:2, partial [Gigaspora rosea]
VRILTEVMLSEIDTEFPVCMTIKGSHVPKNIIRKTTALSQINLNREARDLAIKSHRANKRMTKKIKMKLFAPYNNALQNELEHLYNSQSSICNDIKLRQLIERDTRNLGSFCFGIDGKYDLNSSNAPILSLVVEDNAGFGTPIAFGVSNKENNYTIRLTVEAVQWNILCNNNNCNHEYYYRELANNKGFMRIRECAQLWQPFAMIDKHQPTKREL